MKELMKVDGLNAIDLFEKKEISALVVSITKEAKSLVPDITSDDGRKDIADLCKKVRKCSKILDDMGKSHVSMLKALPKQIDGQRKLMRDDLEALYDDVRKPLTTWEDEEKEKSDQILSKINAMMAMPCGVASERLNSRCSAELFLSELESTVIDDSFGDSKEHAAKTRSENILMVKGSIANFIIEEKAEIDRIEKEKLAVKEREESIAKQAKEKAELADKQAIEDAKKAEEKAKQDAIAEKEKAEIAAKQAVIIAKLNAEKAVEEEKERAEQERLSEIKKQEKLASNKKHCSKINNEALNSITDLLMEYEDSDFQLTQMQCKSIVIAIAKGKIPHISITY